MKNLEVDLVYLWVDGSDEKWFNKKMEFFRNFAGISIEASTKARNADNDELKISLRSVEMHAPWIRKIFIVTDGQCPEWLNLNNEKIQIVDISEILPAEALPCYNSVVIEYFLYKIPGLAERFLYANDDMFFNADTTPDFFFAEDGLPYVRLINKPFGKLRYKWKMVNRKSISMYRRTILHAARLVNEKYNVFFWGIPHHNIDAFIKSDYQKVTENVFKAEADALISHHIRRADDIQRVVFSYYALAVKRAHFKRAKRRDSLVITLHAPNYLRRLDYYQPKLFCMNDNERVSDNDRLRAKEFLRSYFPEKSSFEL